MKKMILILATASLSCTNTMNPTKTFDHSLFIAQDHTGENLFSSNIEGPAVDKDGKLFVVNYQKDGTIGHVNPDGTVELFVTLPEGSIGNSIQFNAAGNMLVADFSKHNVLEVDTKTKAVSVYCHDDRFNQPNDICINKKGIVFASDPDWKNKKGQLWKIGLDKKAVLLKSNMGTTNGICLSPDEKTLYLNESIEKNIWAFDVDADDNISNQRLFTSFTDHGMDGMKCDTKGNLYVTRYGKGTVAIFSPAGKLLKEVELRGKKVSNITFGGKDFKTCFVTLQDRKCMEKFRTDTPGR
ncbi:MAG TPA: SMP-30/gluconolactonase/LRE family protein [Chitinophagaceae bacterium]|nr:SMP-30/gluconolactonase/LRE family protein [Chitinophagaceae bacterium]